MISVHIMRHRRRGKGTKPGPAGRARPLSLRQQVNAASSGKTLVVVSRAIEGYRPEATIHEWMSRKLWVGGQRSVKPRLEKDHPGRRKPRPKARG